MDTGPVCCYSRPVHPLLHVGFVVTFKFRKSSFEFPMFKFLKHIDFKVPFEFLFVVVKVHANFRIVNSFYVSTLNYV